MNTDSMRSIPIPVNVDARLPRLRGSRRGLGTEMPGQRAAAQTFVVNAALGLLAFASTLLVLIRLVERWHVGGGATRSVSLVGVRVGYPAANAGAIAVVALAGLGLIVLIIAVRSAAREWLADVRFSRAMVRRAPSRVNGAWVIEDDRPQAFCAGLARPRVYVSHGALELLGPAELAAVLAHERHHARRHDPLRLAASRVLGNALFLLAPVQGLIARQHSLAEIGADEAAVGAAGGDRAPLASAMLSFSEASGDEGGGLAAERIDHLVGEARSWRLPLAPLLAICLGLATLVTSALLVAETARGSATLALPLLSAQPCIVILASIPAGLGVLGIRHGRTRAAPSPHAALSSTAGS